MTRADILRKIRSGEPMFVTRGGREIVPVKGATPSQPGFATRPHRWGDN